MKNFLEGISSNIIDKDFLTAALESVLIFVAGFILIRIIRYIIRQTLARKMNRQSQMLVNRLVTYAGFSILILIILAHLGIEITAILGAAGVLGIAFGVASQKSLGNIISGLFLVAEKSFEIGDAVKIGDKTGIVYSVDLLSIMLRTFDNLLIRIPNETLITSEITNITKFDIRRLDINLTVAFDTDLSVAQEILKVSAIENLYALNDPEPFILLKDFTERGISIQFGVWFEKSNYALVRNTMIEDIQKRFRDAGIAIPPPQIRLLNGNPL